MVLRRDPMVGSEMMQVAMVVSGPMATMLISSIGFRIKVKRLLKNKFSVNKLR